MSTRAAAYIRDEVFVLEAHIDHLTGEELGHALDRIMEDGALDVLWLPGFMKKGRPGGLLRVMCLPERLEAVQASVFRHTHSLGLRTARVERVTLPREAAAAKVDGETLAAKTYRVDGVPYVRPEYEALAALARNRGTGIVGLRLKAEQP